MCFVEKTRVLGEHRSGLSSVAVSSVLVSQQYRVNKAPLPRTHTRNKVVY